MISMLLIVFLLFGTIAYFTLNLDLMPDVTFPVITIQTIYAGAGPQEIELQVTKKIEDAVSSISNIDELTSYSMESVSFVVIQFDLNKDVDIANQEAKDKIDAVLNQLPKDSERPIVQKFDMNEQPILDILLSGDLEMTELYTIAEKTLKDRFSQFEGIANVNITGGGKREIRINLDNRVVFQNKINLSQLAGMLQMQNMDMPGGHFKQRAEEYSVRLKGEFDNIETIKQLKVPTGFGLKPLNEIADVVDESEEVRVRSSYFDNLRQVGSDNVVMLGLLKSKDGNTVEAARAIKEALPAIEKSLPAGCNLNIVTDKSLMIEGSVEDTLSNILMGIILTGLVLLFFLHDLRSTIIVALSMPMSILSTFLLLQVYGFTLNLMTLMGLSTSVGILVSNSVIVLENIFRHKEMGHNRKVAAAVGTAEVTVAVLASTLTNIAVFLPIANMSSMVGQFFKEFALTVVFATLFSLLISFTLTPMMASLIIPEHDKKKHPLGQKLEAIFHAWENSYQKILAVIIKTKFRSGLVIIIAIAIFIGSFGFAKNIGFDFMPKLDEGDIKLEAELPIGTNLDETATLLKEIELRLREFEQVRHVITILGQINNMNQNTNMALMQIKLVDVADRNETTDEMVTKFIETLADVPNAQLRISATATIGGGREPVNFTLMGQEMVELEKYKGQILERIHDVPGLTNLNTSSRAGKPEITITPDREKLASTGVSVYDMALALRSALEGLVTTKYKDAGEEYDIRVSFADETVNSLPEIENIAIVGKDATYRIAQLAKIEFTEGFSRILHKDKYKMIEFTAGTAPDVALGDITDEINLRLSDLKLPEGYKISWTGMAKIMKDTISDMGFTFLVALLLTYMLLAAILESLTQPLLIMGTVPLALIGVFGGLYMSGVSMNSISMMAIVMLLGIVVNNAILLLDYTNILVREKGKSVHDALLEACPVKLKPILMSSIAIILGMLPMALGIGTSGKEFRQPMGIVSIGGLVVSTILSLIVIPTLYNLTTRANKVNSEQASSR